MYLIGHALLSGLANPPFERVHVVGVDLDLALRPGQVRIERTVVGRDALRVFLDEQILGA